MEGRRKQWDRQWDGSMKERNESQENSSLQNLSNLQNYGNLQNLSNYGNYGNYAQPSDISAAQLIDTVARRVKALENQRDTTLLMMQDRVLRGLDSLSPLRVGETDKYRVPLWEDDRSYILFVGDNLTRTFSKEQDEEHPLELPAEVKAQMAFIKTAKAYEENAVRLLTEPSLARVFINSFPDSYEEIGWRIEENIFVVVLSKKTLEGLRGVPFATS